DMENSDRRLVYGVEATHLSGSQTLVGNLLSQDVSAWQGSAGLRWQPLSRVPMRIGAAYTYSEGRERDGRPTQFQQTGMQSNASYFIGAQTLLDRYNEALQPELGNLLVASGFVSFRGLANEGGIVYSHFTRDSVNSPIVTRHLDIALVTSS